MHSNAILALLACTHPLRLSDHKRNPEKEGAVALNRIDTVILKNWQKMHVVLILLNIISKILIATTLYILNFSFSIFYRSWVSLCGWATSILLLIQLSTQYSITTFEWHSQEFFPAKFVKTNWQPRLKISLLHHILSQGSYILPECRICHEVLLKWHHRSTRLAVPGTLIEAV